jgi:hypothetical protein
MRFISVGLRESGVKMDLKEKDLEASNDLKSCPVARFYSTLPVLKS